MEDIGLTATKQKRKSTLVLELDGDLDVYTAPQLRGELGKALADGGDMPVVLDLRNIGFIDSAGLAALLWAKSARRESRFDFGVVVAPGSQPEQVFRLAGLDSMVSVFQEPLQASRS